MQRTVRRLAVLLFVFFAGTSGAQTFPSRPIQVIVPYGAGGVTDAIARIVVPHVSESVGQPVLVENRPGASTMIGMAACAKAAPDGYTVCITVPDSLSYNPHLFTKVLYDPDRDFIPVTNLGWSSNLIAANANAPFKNFREMIAYAKSKPGALNWGTWGEGTLPDVYLKWVAHQAGIKITAIPYKGAAQLNPALYAGEVDITYLGFGTALPQIKAGKIRALVAVGSRRSPYMPDLPTLAEEGGDPGLPSYFGVFAPAKTPQAIIARLNAEFAKAVHVPSAEEALRRFTVEPVGNSSAEFALFVKADRDNAGKVFRMMGIRQTDAPQ